MLAYMRTRFFSCEPNVQRGFRRNPSLRVWLARLSARLARAYACAFGSRVCLRAYLFV